MTTGRRRPSFTLVFFAFLAAALLFLNPAASYADYIFDFIRLEHRIYEDPARNHDRLAFSVIDKDTGDAPTEDVIADGYIKLGDDEIDGEGSMSISEHRMRIYDEDIGDWVEENRNDIYYRYKFDEPAAVGTYDVFIKFINDQTAELKLDFPGYEDLPFISATSFDFCFTELGDLIWSWELPDGLAEDLEIYGYIVGDGTKEISLIMPGSFEYVVVPKEYMDFLGYEDIKFDIRLMEDRANRAYSDTITIADVRDFPKCSVPEPCTLALVGMSLLGMLGLKRKMQHS